MFYKQIATKAFADIQIGQSDFLIKDNRNLLDQMEKQVQGTKIVKGVIPLAIRPI
ncbi:unnamed protein product [Prunus brigantina]